MLLPGITVTFSLANIFYLIRVIRKYRHLANLQSYLTGFRHLNVSEVLEGVDVLDAIHNVFPYFRAFA